MILSALIVCFYPPLRVISQHGKNCCVHTAESAFLVPKRFFTHFYLLSCFLFGISVVYDLFWTRTVHAVNVLFLIHSIRRLWESCRLFYYGESKMHVLGYFCGIGHYLLAFVTLQLALVERVYSKSNHSTYTFWFAVITFLIMNLLQHQSHRILAKAKKIAIEKSKYTLPHEGMFRVCSCPHYFAEICIYFCLFLLESHSIAVFVMFIWVLVNLSVVAYQQYHFYLANDFESLEKGDIKILFPFLW